MAMKKAMKKTTLKFCGVYHARFLCRKSNFMLRKTHLAESMLTLNFVYVNKIH